MARARKTRRRLSLTSLIDVIFLLLLFFMLSSTFSKFSEVELTAGGTGQNARASDVPPVFLRLAEADLSLNGQIVPIEALSEQLQATAVSGNQQPVIVSLREDVTSQRLTDLLVTLRDVPDLAVTVLGGG